MQKFTRALTREIVVGGERLAVTLSEEGMSYRVVGSRKPPYEMTWTACLCACTQGREHPPGEEEVATALKALRAGGKEPSTASPTKTEHAAAEDSAGHHPEHHVEQHTGHHAEQPVPAHHAPHAHEPPPLPHPPPLEQPSAERTTREPATKAAAKSANGPLPTLLARLDAWLVAHRPRFAKGLLPGATAEQLAVLELDIGHALPPELHAWLSWHNGQNAEVPGAFVESWHLLGTRRIAQLKTELDANPSANWNRDWIPFLDDDSGDYVCLDASTATAPVRECWRGKQEPPIVAESLTEWVEKFVTALEKGEYVEDPERGDFFKK